ncbi:MAG: hypothetical protein ACREDR_11250 [Blastocatellia bacterium]
MAKKLSADQYKKYAAIGLGTVFVLVFVYNIFLSGDGTHSSQAPAKTASAEGKRSESPVATPVRKPANTGATSSSGADAVLQALLSDVNPLDLDAIKRIKEGSETARGDMFDFYHPPPTPVPVVPTPTPPPIAVRFVEPVSAIAGTPKPFQLKVSGSPLPPDAQIIFNGAPRQTKRVDDGTLTTEIAASDYGNAGSMEISVRSASKPKELYSNSVMFSVQPAPAPPFKMVGLIGDLAILEVGTGNTKQYLRMRRGETYDGVWRIDAVNDNGIEVTDTRYDIKKVVPLEAKARV